MSATLAGLAKLPKYLTFRAEPTEFLVQGLGATPAESVIRFSLKLPFGHSIETPDGRSLRDIAWSLDVHEGVFDRAEGQDDANGLLTYSEAYEDDYPSWPEGAGAFFYLAPPVFATLRDAVLAGRTPHEVAFSARGMASGWAPDGSDAVWDIKTKPSLPLVDLRVSFALDDPEDATESAEDPMRSYLRGHQQSMAIHNALAQSTSRYLLWIFWAVVILLLMLWAK